jgi:biopolymer transport protein ExbD
MNYLLEVCLTIALATGIMPSLVAQSNPDAVPMMRKGISVQMPVTRTAMPMPDADKEDATVVIITEDGGVYLGLNPTDADAVAGSVRDVLSSQPGKNVYVKADARAPYSQVHRVLAVLRAAGVEAPSLLTSQPHTTESGTLLPPEGLGVLVGPRRAPSSPAIVQLSPQRSVLKVDGEPVPRASLQNRLAQFFQNRSDKIVQIEADGSLPFAVVVDVIDGCRAAGAKVVLATPTL